MANDLQPWIATSIALAILIAVMVIANWISKRIIVRIVMRLLARMSLYGETPALGAVVTRLSNIVPALVIQLGIVLVPGIPMPVFIVVQNVAAAFIIMTIGLAIGAALNFANYVYERRPEARNRPIKGFLEVTKIIVYGVAVILIIAALIDRSPVLLFSGLGAMAAILLLVFKDTLLSLVASVQLSSNDMLRVGDWIEMPQFNADGDVIDIALHTVKVQNWDKTITTIPTYRLIEGSFKNWRGMFESGGRRISRSLLIDQRSIRFLTSGQWDAMRRFALLCPYLESKEKELREWNAKNPDASKNDVNKRRPTNIGTFRAYVMAYLNAHPCIAQDKTLLVRQLAPTQTGLPIQIYCFTTTTAWDG
ncbi:MAG: mechanosensitive ion channel family protein, partial [Alphaproteobacteria bacterium]